MKVDITQTDNQVMVTLDGRLDTVTSSEFEKSLAPYFSNQGVEQILDGLVVCHIRIHCLFKKVPETAEYLLLDALAGAEVLRVAEAFDCLLLIL